MPSNTKSLLDRIQELYEEGLKSQTNWGRNAVLAMYKDCVLKALKEQIVD